MIFISLIIPLIISIILYTKKHNPILLWAPTIVTGCILGIAYIICLHSNVSDIEYLSYYYTKIRHEDKWNERVLRTKTRTVIINGKPHSQTYHVWETVTHPDRYLAYLNNDKTITISKDKYNTIKHLWKTPEIFIDMHRDYYTIDGDAQEHYWNNEKCDIQIHTKTHEYINKILGSDSQFKHNDISKKEAKELGLYDYPDIIDNKQNPIIGYTKFITEDDVKNVQFLNSFYGYGNQITYYILIYPNTNVSIVEDQKAFWQGGNKNEFIICVGIDSISNKVQWANCFSWQDDITMDVNCKNYIYKMDTLNVTNLSNWLEQNIHLWKRKEFSDFSYLNVDLSTDQNILLLVLVIFLSIITTMIGYHQLY